MNWKWYGRKRSWPNSRYYPGICLERLKKTMKTLSQDSRSPGRDLNPEPPEYEARVLTTLPWCLFLFLWDYYHSFIIRPWQWFDFTYWLHKKFRNYITQKIYYISMLTTYIFRYCYNVFALLSIIFSLDGIKVTSLYNTYLF
jgi:hypothetical protein